MQENNMKPLAIYLPQYHSIPENDEAWGKDFTEWTNVKKAQPLFDGHYQPHIPHESIGYYDLKDPEVLVKQADLAKEYGIHGFAFYHYWFNGKRLLNLPVDNMLNSGKPDFPFCLIWANEDWTKKWEGNEKEIIIKQDYSFQDDKNHMEFLCKDVFSDKRYIRIDDKPVFLIYRTELFPDIKRTVKIWRDIAKEHGYKGLYLIRVENFERGVDPKSIGFDAAMEFAPDWYCSYSSTPNSKFNRKDYSSTVFNMLLKPYNYKVFRSVFSSWDNSARSIENSTIYTNNNIDVFRYYLQNIIEYTKISNSPGEQFIFINAWNEWGEGCHIEPDMKYGYEYLETIKTELSENNKNNNLSNIYKVQRAMNKIGSSSLKKKIRRVLKKLLFK